MVLKIMIVIIMLGLGFSTSGCAVNRAGTAKEKNARTFAENYRRSKEARRMEKENVPASELKLSAGTGYVKPYLPVVLPPQVMKVWVPAHIAENDRKVLISGHWSFVMLKEADWYIEREITEGLSFFGMMPLEPKKEE